MGSSFHRGYTVCDVQLASDGWEWHAYVAVDRDHPIHGLYFVQVGEHNLDHVTHVTGLELHDARWWYAIEGGSVDSNGIMQKLLRVSDELTQMMSASS